MRLKSGVRSATIFFSLGFFSLAASVALFVDRSSSTKLGPSLVQGVLDSFGLLWVQILYFLTGFMLLHGATGWALDWLAKPFLERVQDDEKKLAQSVLLILLLAFLFLVLESASRFPHTLLGNTLGEFAASAPGLAIRWAIGIGLAVILVAGLAIRLAHTIREHKRSRIFRALTATLLLGMGLSAWNAAQQPAQLTAFEDRPHIILIGIDGWRLDALPQYQGRSDIMPNVKAFFDAAAWMERAATPVARTYPAWWTILTGQYPASHGVRFNLIPDSEIRTPLRLPMQLGALGYHRIFAMDERRFANFRKNQGFDRIVGPAMGAADFVLGDLADTPLTNLVANTWIGRILFPYTHSNRAAYKTYDPEVFDALVSSAIHSAPQNPLFLLVHYELPHWPFKWAEGPADQAFSSDFDPEQAEYMEALHRTDHQIGSLFHSLERKGVLENALVVMLSDHGEGLSQDDQSWEDPETGQRRPVPAGHGNSVISVAQHLVPLAFRRYGKNSFPTGMRSGTASLADIYPTISELIHLPDGETVDGESIATVLMDESGSLPARAIPLETGFNTESSLEGEMEPGRLFQEGAVYYQVLKDGRLQIRPGSLSELISGKQRGILYGTQLFMPVSAGSSGDSFAFIGNIQTHQFKIENLSRRKPDIAFLNERYWSLFNPDFQPAQSDGLQQPLLRFVPGAGVVMETNNNQHR